MNSRYFLLSILTVSFLVQSIGQTGFPEMYNVVWDKQSINSSESMPCGGGDIGMNVWVEDGELLFYFSRSGTFDENNEFLKLGRIRVKLSPNPLEGEIFNQELNLEEGRVKISGEHEGINASIQLWTDVFHPNIYLDIESNKPIAAEVFYENWRFEDFELRKNESFANSFKWAPFKGLKKFKDSISNQRDKIIFFHRNKHETVFDVTVKQQGLDSLKDELYNPLSNLTFGGMVFGRNMEQSESYEGQYLDTKFKGLGLRSKTISKNHEIIISLHTEQCADLSDWCKNSQQSLQFGLSNKKKADKDSKSWWSDFWSRSYIVLDEQKKDSVAWQVGRNYQLFRYMLGCNAYGTYPTKFNGGLFTYDPRFTDSNRSFTPDYRNWCGGTFTAQNQRLVYFPMLKSGDFDMMKPQFDFYNRILETAELRSKAYWGHGGACFTEQLENFGLPNSSEYGWGRPEEYDKGMQYNAWLEFQWDTSLEFCLMILNQYFYVGTDISEYIDLVLSCLQFFDEHYQYLASQRGIKKLDDNGDLVLYPGSACETYKMAYNAVSTIAGLKSVTKATLDLPENYLSKDQRESLESFMKRIPPMEYRELDGKMMIAPAKLWERVNNTETPQLYPVFPWKMFGVGKAGLDTAIHTYKYDPDALKFRSHVGWKQDNIWAARLGLADEAWKYTSLKLKDSGRRFPAFWGPGFDWVPDHNWGGSGMIGLQEMFIQEADGKIYIYPAWPTDIDARFKLHVSGNTIIEAEITGSKINIIKVTPENRRRDIVLIR